MSSPTPNLPPSRPSELLAPVGDMDMCRAAVHNGADAVYVGYPGFNARGRTADHSWEALADMADFCRRHEVKLFLALNVLIFERELRELLDTLPRALALGADAFIVQDLGLARLLRRLSPVQVLHASTQMTVTNHEAMALTRDLDLARYVLGREVSIAEMETIRRHTGKELEVFVHGALCVAYSGQCLTSEGFGGRSANRGQCAQSCRMEYDLIVDGERRDLGARRYLVSPKDLCGLADIPRLMALGIDSFKIEGRLKTPQYVASVTGAYKRAMAGIPPESAGIDDLQITYSRGFFNGWLGGVDHQRLVDGRYGSHRGLDVGRTVSRRGSILRVTSRRPLAAGEGLLFARYPGEGPAPAGKPAAQETWGARIYSATEIPGAGAAKAAARPVAARPDAAGIFAGTESLWDLTFAKDFPVEAVPAGAVVYLNDSPALEKSIRRTYADKEQWKTLPISMRMEGVQGSPLRVIAADAAGRTGAAETGAPLQPARDPASGLMRGKAEAAAGALAGTGYRLERFDFAVEAGLFLPDRELRKARQAAVAALQTARDSRPEIVPGSAEEARAWMDGEALADLTATGVPPAATGHLNLLVRERSSLEALVGLPLRTVYLDFEHGKDYKPAVEQVRRMGYRAGIATTRILKPAEYHNLKVIEAIRPDVVLVRNLGALQYLRDRGLELAGDFSLNVANSLAAAYLAGKGLSTLCPSYDLNQGQLLDLVDACGGGRLEVTVHQYLPSFHMEHCVFAAFLSGGSSFRDCGKPCESHRVELRDHTGAVHPLKADQECRNTMFNGRPQSAALLVPALLARGVRAFRVEALYEDAETLRAKVTAYAALAAGEAAPASVFREMGLLETYGVTEGSFKNAAEHRDRKKG